MIEKLICGTIIDTEEEAVPVKAVCVKCGKEDFGYNMQYNSIDGYYHYGE